MSPLVAGTMPAKSGKEAFSSRPARCHSVPGPPRPPTSGRGVPHSFLFLRATQPSKSHLILCKHARIMRFTYDLANDPSAFGCFGLHLPLSGNRSRAPAAGGFVVSPALGPVQPSIRVDHITSMIVHHLLHSSTDDSKPELGKRAHLTHGSLTGHPEPFSVAPSSPVCS
jgi:hypothetical protein